MPDAPDSTAFALDRVENPHPVMLTRALQFRRAAHAADDPIAVGFWLGYRDAMCDATGCTSLEIEAWMDRHDTTDVDAMRRDVPVEIKR